MLVDDGKKTKRHKLEEKSVKIPPLDVSLSDLHSSLRIKDAYNHSAVGRKKRGIFDFDVFLRGFFFAFTIDGLKVAL